MSFHFNVRYMYASVQLKIVTINNMGIILTKLLNAAILHYYYKVSCPKLPLMAYGNISTVSQAVGTVVIITCHYGYNLPDGTNQMVSVCTDELLWQPPVDKCEGEAVQLKSQ